MLRIGLRRWQCVVLLVVALLVLFGTAAPGRTGESGGPRVRCEDGSPLCTDVLDSIGYEGHYTGHDEPAVLFYSTVPGAGNNNVWRLRLPLDPPTLPTQDGSGGTFNFQLHPAFWFGMAMCDTQSAPNFTSTCVPDTDANIFDNADPGAPDYIGRHPGTAFMEMQFYPPGWVPWPAGTSCDPFTWCAALTIDSLSMNQNTGQINNTDCDARAGLEPVNFAFVTKSGVAHAPANPLDATAATFMPDSLTDLFMNPGDELVVSLGDTPDGFQVVIQDVTTGESGSMTASVANGFAQIRFDPTGTTCQAIPYAFHPMYSTSSEHTRVPWAAHTYNIAFSDEIGHFEYHPSAVPGETGDADDNFCFSPADSTRVQIGGCTDIDIDFDGVSYQTTWPGSLANPGQNRRFNPTSVLFSSPRFNATQGYDRVAFEADLPRIESAANPACNRTTGANCVNPPVGANFYPIFSTRRGGGGCVWQLGGVNIPGTKNTFGGDSAAEFGSLLLSVYPGPGFVPLFLFNNFRQVLSDNPCTGHAGGHEGD